jgi:hypothetical protein
MAIWLPDVLSCESLVESGWGHILFHPCQCEHWLVWGWGVNRRRALFGTGLLWLTLSFFFPPAATMQGSSILTFL